MTSSTLLNAQRLAKSPYMTSRDRTRRTHDAMAITQPMLKAAESCLGGPLLTYWNSGKGIISQDDADAYRYLLTGFEPVQTIFLSLTSNGGHGEASLRLAEVIRQYCKRLVVIVPRFAKSAATMWALAADEIRLGPSACLGPVDTSISHPLAQQGCDVGEDELRRILNLWRREGGKNKTNPYAALYQYIHPLVIGATDRAATMSMKICDALLAYHESRPQIRRKIAKHLIYGYPSHSFPIMLDEARRIGLKANPVTDRKIDEILLGQIAAYSAFGEKRRRDADPGHHHDVEIGSILECRGKMVFFRDQSNWSWTDDKREWMPTDRETGWFMMESDEKREIALHIR